MENLATGRFGDIQSFGEVDEGSAPWRIVVAAFDRLIEQPLLALGQER